MPPYLTLSIIMYGSRVKWSNPWKGVAPSPTPRCSKLSKREPSGHPRLWSSTLLFFVIDYYWKNYWKKFLENIYMCNFWELIFILRPTSVRIWHKAVFKVGTVAGPKPNAIGSSKNASDPVGIPLFGAPEAPGDKPNPSEEGYSLGRRAPDARGDVSSGGTHPNRLWSSQPQLVESAPPQDTKHRT